MTRSRTIDILRHLRDGVDPRDGRLLAPDHVCSSGEVVRALFEAVAVLTVTEGAEAARSRRRSRRAVEIAAAAPDDETLEMTAMEVTLPAAQAAPYPEPRRRTRPPNAGQPWSEDDDRRLAEAFDGGASLDELTESFGRTKFGIRARLTLLGRGDLLGPGQALRYPILSPVAEEPGEEPSVEESAAETSADEQDRPDDERSASGGGPSSRGDRSRGEPIGV